MAKVLLLFAHPALEKSRVHKALLQKLPLPGVHFHDLYEAYPDFDIDVKAEQQLLLSHDVILFQHPFYWYSAPALIKQWQDLVLEHNWAYGPEGRMLAGKTMGNIISCGGRREAYGPTGYNRFTIPQYLMPFDQTARLCKMTYLPPFAIHGTHALTTAEISFHAQQYEQMLTLLTEEKVTATNCTGRLYLNETLSGEPMH